MTWLTGCRRTAVLRRGWGLVGALATVSLLIPSIASASDTFTLANNSNSGYALVGVPHGDNTWVDNCFVGAWSSASAGQKLPPLNPGQNGGFMLSVAPFSDCNTQHAHAVLTDSYAAVTGTTTGANSGGGFAFNAEDPTVGPASITNCSATGTASQYLQFQTNQDSLTCSVSAAPGTPAVHFVASTAAVRRGAAFVPIQEFGKRRLGFPYSGRVEVILRSLKGQLLGRGTQIIGVGASRVVRVPVTPSVLKQIRGNKSHAVTVQATLKRVDGKAGAGDRIELTLRTPNRGLQF
jgi:hypothetical protein